MPGGSQLSHNGASLKLPEQAGAMDHSVELEELAELLRETVIRLQPSSEEISTAWSSAQVTMQQLRIMTILYHDGPTKVSDLAIRLGVSTPTITGILDRLVRQRLSFRMSDHRDRRVVLNNLTQDGRDLVERLLPAHGSQAEVALARLDARERALLNESLHALLRVMPTP